MKEAALTVAGVMVIFGSAVLIVVLFPKSPEPPCSYYENLPISYAPARCVKELTR